MEIKTDKRHYLKPTLLLSDMFARPSLTVFPSLVMSLSLWYNNKRGEVEKNTMVKDVSTWKLIIKLSCDFILISLAAPLILCCRPLH